MARLFVALELPEDVRETLAELCRGVSAARWVRPAQMHLTLRFLGEIADATLGDVERAFAGIAAAAFELGLAGVGRFPAGRRPAQVLWAGVAPREPAAALKVVIDEVLDPVIGRDHEAAQRGFAPHVTLARFRDRPGPDLEAYLAAHARLGGPQWAVSEVVLFRSELGPQGARHVPLVRTALARAS